MNETQLEAFEILKALRDLSEDERLRFYDPETNEAATFYDCTKEDEYTIKDEKKRDLLACVLKAPCVFVTDDELIGIFSYLEEEKSLYALSIHDQGNCVTLYDFDSDDEQLEYFCEKVRMILIKP